MHENAINGQKTLIKKCVLFNFLVLLFKILLLCIKYPETNAKNIFSLNLFICTNECDTLNNKSYV